MTNINRATATSITLSNLPTFTTANAFPLSRIRKEVLFSVAQRVGELTAVDAPLVNDWINDAYTQIMGMLENTRTGFSTQFTLPLLTETIALSAAVDQIHSINSIIDDFYYQLHKSVDTEYWRSLDRDNEIDNDLNAYFVQQDNAGLLVQFRRQSTAVLMQIEGTVRPPRLMADTDCPALDEPLCLGLVDLAISIVMRRLGDHTYSGVQNNAALAVIRSHIDTRGQSRRGTVAAVSRPRTQAEARRMRGT